MKAREGKLGLENIFDVVKIKNKWLPSAASAKDDAVGDVR